MAMNNTKPTVAVHKFSSCDGCQLAFLNAGEALLQLAERVEILHFAEAGMLNEDVQVDIAFVEGSVNTHHDEERIRQVRANSRYLITIGACATAGGVQALRNIHDNGGWHQAIYAHPEYLDSLSTATTIAKHVKVDLELWGCPVNTQQVMQAVATLLHGATPAASRESVCAECKRRGNVCVVVTQGQHCLGPHTHAGCNAICPHMGRGCYGCYGPQGVIYAGAA
ncbi:sulfhydrogenase subunit delta [Thiothrix nivea]|uniref:NADH ubiquinone oxidoreductase 20 kDa subunit n=1 Tax=Thiothrix nivea (strain ATCC 35100 / DSM 5205 / JP2) TaxID=870187 RepID=A0A656HHB9_THINJ|nr:sulfhydrogenase subunit delta [Thiothrix nivea]EIJ34425.1 NADH ubiquinone oxidoreductase 20 kDa subunit [Thiothrix nivea DSM 5205]